MEDELRKNQVLDCAVEGCTSEGLGVARVGGRAVFVQDALPGESCRIQLLKVSRSAVYARVDCISRLCHFIFRKVRFEPIFMRTA